MTNVLVLHVKGKLVIRHGRLCFVKKRLELLQI
jgi:hypothetical protein